MWFSDLFAAQFLSTPTSPAIVAKVKASKIEHITLEKLLKLTKKDSFVFFDKDHNFLGHLKWARTFNVLHQEQDDFYPEMDNVRVVKMSELYFSHSNKLFEYKEIEPIYVSKSDL
tara:strand:+ start:971 stop:1315 length:345 start_codon:yes stop_codon:yes gene_type:complete